jgi:transposase-like protein
LVLFLFGSEEIMQTQATKVNGRVKRSATDWQEIMTQYERSGRSRAAFCRSQSISPSTFDVWYRKLRSEKGPQEFVEVKPVEETSIGGWLVEFELPDGTLARMRG